jgi:hypothetical protein
MQLMNHNLDLIIFICTSTQNDFKSTSAYELLETSNIHNFSFIKIHVYKTYKFC